VNDSYTQRVRSAGPWLERFGAPVLIVQLAGDAPSALVGWNRRAVHELALPDSVPPEGLPPEALPPPLGARLTAEVRGSNGEDEISFVIALQGEQHRWFQVILAPGPDDEEERDRAGFVVTLLELTALRGLEDEVARLERHNGALSEIARELCDGPYDEMQSALRRCLVAVGTALGCRRLDLVEVSTEPSRIDEWLEWTGPGVPPLRDALLDEDPQVLPWLVDGLREQPTLRVPRLDELPGLSAPVRIALRRARLGSMLVALVDTGPRTRGTLAASWAEAEGWGRDSVKLVGLVAELMSQALLRHRGERDGRLAAQNLQQELRRHRGTPSIVGLDRVRELIRRVAPTDTPVLIEGETGTGKELVANAIHSQSTRRSRTLLTVNGAAIPENLAESELFGHQRGAFTGAVRRHVGWFERADGGTIFLDEVGELSLAVQAKLLRVLQSGRVEPVGGERTRWVDVRVLAASNRDLWREVEEGRFRRDLYYRLAVFPLRLPPLRDRIDDLPPLVDELLSRFAPNRRVTLTDESMDSLRRYDWPGNVRELENVLQRALLVSNGHAELRPEHLTFVPRSRQAASDALEEVQRRHILDVLERCDWVVEAAARKLDIAPSTLRSRMQKLGIHRPS